MIKATVDEVVIADASTCHWGAVLQQVLSNRDGKGNFNHPDQKFICLCKYLLNPPRGLESNFQTNLNNGAI